MDKPEKNTLDLQTLLQNMPDLYLILNPQFDIVAISAAYAKAIHLKQDEILGHNIFDVFLEDPSNPQAKVVIDFRHSLERVLETKRADSMGIQKYDIQFSEAERKAPTERYWSVVNIPVLGKESEVKFIINRADDVTDYILFKQKNQKENGKTLTAQEEAMEVAIFNRARDLQMANQVLQEKDEALRLSEERQRLMIEGTRDYAILMLDPQGYIKSWNSGAERIKGYKASEIIGKHFSIFYTQEAKDRHHPETELKIAKEQGHYEEEGWRVRKDGSKFWANVLITPVYDSKANLIGFGKVTRDLTERRKVEQLKNEFVSAVSHELRTPLTSIRGSLSLILGGAVGDLSEKCKNLLEIASNNCNRLVHLINDILDVEKIEAGKMVFKFQDYDLGKLIEEAILINRMYGEKFHVKIMGKNLLSHINVTVDIDRLMQVISNLLSNAIKFSPRGGLVVISMSQQNSHVRVSVTDQGKGIPEEFKNKIFQRFSQADASTTRQEGGTGLGLAISKAIMERLGGRLGFTSEKGKGSTFYFDLPLSHQQQPIEGRTSSEGLDKKRVLICEDDEDQANYLSTLIQGAGYETDICYTAAQAKRFLNERDYYVLLLDLVLPDMNGIQLIKELRGASSDHKVPIIVVSVIAKEGKVLLNGHAFEVVDWLEKPIDFNKLSKAFSSIQRYIKVEKPNILHVEDDVDAQKVVSNLLQDRSSIIAVTTMKEAEAALAKHPFDLVILDLLLPDGNGAELLPLVGDYQIPVIVFASSELDPKYARFVKEALIKSKTCPEKLLEAIHHLLHQV